jgi:hypothetical protein
MIEIYRRLDQGASCAEALCAAQPAVRTAAPDPHDVGKILCIGISSPLSSAPVLTAFPRNCKLGKTLRRPSIIKE